MARTAAKSAFQLPTIARRRSTWEQRTAVHSKAAKLAAQAMTEKPVFIEDDDGHRMKVWQQHELHSYSHSDIVTAIRGQRAVEREDLLEFIPPGAIKYCTTKGWLFESTTTRGVFWVTRKAAAELDLPRKAQGRTIQFLDRGL